MGNLRRRERRRPCEGREPSARGPAGGGGDRGCFRLSAILPGDRSLRREDLGLDRTNRVGIDQEGGRRELGSAKGLGTTDGKSAGKVGRPMAKAKPRPIPSARMLGIARGGNSMSWVFVGNIRDIPPCS